MIEGESFSGEPSEVSNKPENISNEQTPEPELIPATPIVEVEVVPDILVENANPTEEKHFSDEQADNIAPVLATNPQKEVLERVIGPEGWTDLDRDLFRKESASKRTWKRLMGRVSTAVKTAISKSGQRNDRAVDYASETNYPELLPYEDCYAGARYWSLVTEKMENIGTESPEILEIGCATGNLLEVIAEKFPQSHLTGVDISQKSLELAAKRLPSDTDLYKVDLNNEALVESLFEKIKGKTFDAIILLDVVEHLDQPEKQDKLMERLRNCLQEDGRMIVGMPEKSGKSDFLLRRVFKNAWNKADVDTTHFNKPTPERFNELMSGFDIVDDHGYFPIPQPLGRLIKLSFSANRMMVGKKQR